MRNSVDCVMLFAMSSWLSLLDGTNVCSAVYQLYYLYMKHIPLRLERISRERAMVGMRMMSIDPFSSYS